MIQLAESPPSVSFRNSPARRHASPLVFAFAYTIAANVPFWIAARFLHLLPVGWFCLEFAATGVLALLLPRAAVSIVLAAIMAADLLSAVSRTYYLSPSDCLANLNDILDFPASRLLTFVGILALIGVVAAIPFLSPARDLTRRGRWLAALPLVGFMLAGVAVDCNAIAHDPSSLPVSWHVLNVTHASDINRISDRSHLWAGRYPLLRLWREWILFAHVPLSGSGRVSLSDAPPITGAVPVALAGSGILSPNAPRPAPNLVLILAESWGSERKAAIREGLTAPYAQAGVLSRYRVLQGTVPFVGSTVGGETRELCGSTLGAPVAAVPTAGLASCLPSRLKAIGYHAVALHGMDRTFFRRDAWWKTVGFEQTWFVDDFRRQSLPDCVGAFVGTCDAAVAQFLGKRLESDDGSPSLFYWVTLDSHLPLRAPSELSRPVSCAGDAELSARAPLCSWYKLVGSLHRDAAALAMGKLARPTVFVVVGDHAPPFSSGDLRSHFDPGRVPYVILIPK